MVLDQVSQCRYELSDIGWKVYVTFLFSSTLAIPALIIAICYVHIVYTIWHKSKLVMVSQQRLRKRLKTRQATTSSYMDSQATAITLVGTSVYSNSQAVRSTNEDAHKRQSESQSYLGCDSHHIIGTTECGPGTCIPDDLGEHELDTDNEQTSSEAESLQKAHVALNHRVQLIELAEMNNKTTKSDGESVADRGLSRYQTDPQQPASDNKINGSSYLTRQHGSGVIPKARIKTVKMTLVIVAAFILCWSPFYIFNMLTVYHVIKKDNSRMIALSTLTQSLAHLNSAVNPIIYWLFSGRRSSGRKKSRHPAATSSEAQ